MTSQLHFIIFLVFVGSLMLAYYIRRVAALQREARENPLPKEADEITKEIIVHTYQVQFELKRLKQSFPDPLTALVDALHARGRGE